MTEFLALKTVVLSEGLPPASDGWTDVVYVDAGVFSVGMSVIRPDLDKLFVRQIDGWLEFSLDAAARNTS